MPAAAAAAIAPKLMIKGGKDPITPLLIIMQPFDKHFLLCREMVVARNPDVLIYLLKTVDTKTIKICP
jgi:hypothetical protein